MNMRGFTLIELLIVIVIIGMVFGIAVPSFQSYRSSQTFNQAAMDVEETLSVARNYAASNVYPSSTDAQNELNSGGCLSQTADFVGYGVSIPDSLNNTGNTTYSLDIVFTCPNGGGVYEYYPADKIKWVKSLPISQNISFTAGSSNHIVFPFLNKPILSGSVTLQNNFTPPLTKTISVSPSGVISMN